ncbi:MAG: hypothetical protein KGZ58_13790, partial [Ignavibacteriales bacterium]|nr:hypothetical protein [Ignavibacteriales bacterium]
MSAETITIQQIPLGLRQFQRLYQKYATFAFIIAILLHFAAIGAYFFVVYVLEEEEPVYTVRILKYSDL